MTLDCLESIERRSGTVRREVIVVDNNSNDGSADAIAARFPGITLIRQAVNVGFAAACNLAARDAQGDYILLLNPDTLLRDRALDLLVAFARRRPGAGIWGGRTEFADGTLNPMSCWRQLTLWNLFCSGFALDTHFRRSPVFNSYAYGGWQRDTERTVDVVSGCFLLVSKTLWDRLGGFDPEFYMYGEDADLCLRAAELGFRPAVTPEATIVHYGSGTETDKLRKMRQVLASRALLIRKHMPMLLRPLALGLLALRPMLGGYFAKPCLRSTWTEIWSLRGQWMAGRF
jgi:GT2 family glycosyltransferase